MDDIFLGAAEDDVSVVRPAPAVTVARSSLGGVGGGEAGNGILYGTETMSGCAASPGKMTRRSNGNGLQCFVRG